METQYDYTVGPTCCNATEAGSAVAVYIRRMCAAQIWLPERICVLVLAVHAAGDSARVFKEDHQGSSALGIGGRLLQSQLLDAPMLKNLFSYWLVWTQ
jgi:hypothetical protein